MTAITMISATVASVGGFVLVATLGILIVCYKKRRRHQLPLEEGKSKSTAGANKDTKVKLILKFNFLLGNDCIITTCSNNKNNHLSVWLITYLKGYSEIFLQSAPYHRFITENAMFYTVALILIKLRHLSVSERYKT